MKIRQALLVVTAAFGLSLAHAEQENLQIDGFSSGDPAVFQAGFVASEIAAVRFEPTLACPCVLEELTVLFGGVPETRVMGIQVWEDTAGLFQPGPLVYSGEVILTGSNDSFQVIDLTQEPIEVTGPFRIGLEFRHFGLPAVATDLDGSISVDANFIFATFSGQNFWFRSSDLGVSGDFIMRTKISGLDGTDTDGDGVLDATDNCQSVANAAQTDSNDDGYGNACDTDLNDDCVTNTVDLGLLRVAFFSSPGGDSWNPNADFNDDSIVNVVDLGIMRSQFFMAPGPSGVADECN